MGGVLLLSPCCREPLYRYAMRLEPGQAISSWMAKHLTGEEVKRGEMVKRCPRCGATPKLHRLIQQEPNG